MMSLAKTALIIAAHGDRGTTKANKALLSHVVALNQTGTIGFCTGGVLSGSPSLEEAFEQVAHSGAERLLVFPFFMANGYFVNTVLKNKIDEANLQIPARILPPLCESPQLAHQMDQIALEQARQLDMTPAHTRLLIVGHGSTKSSASFEATNKIAHQLQNKSSFEKIETCFLEEEPFLITALENDMSPTLISGFFAQDGLHGADDIPEAIDKTGSNAKYIGSIGAHHEIPKIIFEQVRLVSQNSNV